MKRTKTILFSAIVAVLVVSVVAIGQMTVESFLESIYDSTNEGITFVMGGWLDALDIEDETALTNTVHPILDLKHTTTETPVIGIGLEIRATQETTNDNDEIVGSVGFVVDDETAATEDASFSVELMAGGAAKAEKFSVESTGEVTLVNSGVIDNTTDGTVLIDEPSSATNTVIDILTVGHSTSGTAAAGIGTGIAFQTEDDGGAVQTGMTLDAVVTTATAGSEDYDFVVGLMDGGVAAAERLRVASDGLVTLVNDETIDNTVDGTVTYTATTHAFAGAVTADTSVDITGSTGLILENDETITNAVDGTVLVTAPVFNVSAAFVPEFETSDPCGTFPEGAIFYNDTSNYMCFCDQAGDDLKMTDNTTACF